MTSLQLFLPELAPSPIDKHPRPSRKASGPGLLGDFQSSLDRGIEFFEFVILNSPSSSPRGDRITPRPRGRGGAPPPGPADGCLLSAVLCRATQDRASGQWTNAFVVYHDQYRQDGSVVLPSATTSPRLVP